MERETVWIHHGTRSHPIGEPCPICKEAQEEFEDWVKSEDYHQEKELYGTPRYFPTSKDLLPR